MDATDGTQRDWGGVGILDQRRYALDDRDTKFCACCSGRRWRLAAKADSTAGTEP
jgi:hypothetical protein